MDIALRRAAAPLLLGAGAVVVAAAVLVGGGSSDDRLFWIGTAALVAAAAWWLAASAELVDGVVQSRHAVAFLALFGGFVVWNGISVDWSIAPDRSWDYFNRGLAYFAFALVGVFVGAQLRDASRVVACALAAIVAVTVSWALVGKIVPAIASDNARIARLHLPVGYWNALALLIDMALPVALWLASRREHPSALRAAGTLLLYASLVALLLTYSRGGIAVGMLAVGLWFLLGRPRLESAAALALAAAPAVAVAVWAFSLAGVADDRQSYSTRVHDGSRFGVVLLLGAGLVFAVAYAAARREAERPLSPEWRLTLGRAALIAAAVVAVATVATAAATVDITRSFREFTRQTSPTVSAGPERLGTLGSSSRWDWWREAWHAFRKQPIKGTGAGSFELTHNLLRRNSFFVTEPHNVPLQFLTELGIVGFLLAAGAAAAAIAGTVATLRRLDGGERAAAAALAAGAVAYVLHALGDFDWDFVAVTAPFVFVVGVLAGSASAGPRFRPRPFWALAGALVALAAIYSLMAPWLANRDVSAAYSALARGQIRSATDHARRAHDLNPLAVDPLFARAAAAEQLGADGAASRLYTQAVELQPLNWRTWYTLAEFETSQSRYRAALNHAQRAAQLNRNGIPPLALVSYLRTILPGG